jgi:hypothetical protein
MPAAVSACLCAGPLRTLAVTASYRCYFITLTIPLCSKHSDARLIEEQLSEPTAEMAGQDSFPALQRTRTRKCYSLLPPSSKLPSMATAGGRLIWWMGGDPQLPLACQVPLAGALLTYPWL